MPHYLFEKDLPVAQATERQVARLLERAFNASIIKFCETNEYDILAIIKSNFFTFEVKEDFTCERTGNVSLEFECRGKPSGISVTKADFYVYKVHTKKGVYFYLIKTNTLKEMINNEKYFRIAVGGDVGSDSKVYLFRFVVFEKFAKFIAREK